jgi:hypothetical protein
MEPNCELSLMQLVYMRFIRCIDVIICCVRLFLCAQDTSIASCAGGISCKQIYISLVVPI